MEKNYSVRHLGLFSRPLLKVEEGGFHYKGRFYTYRDVEAVNVTGGLGQPQRLSVRLKGRKLILVHAGALELNGKKAKTGFFSGNNQVFEDLKNYFLELKQQNIAI
ncbi:hypothetical protein [Marinimicrobium sp. ABcell2]|uniref:hypothetical protein n=1 Tax=Marinimicrobium sp. ABcell2 TaxID=3069751 RepID=UPI0027B41905|nr:hypothetical protein [Marinimicrobium sp. ABcell2]MDQ2078396.1 hypothetical protein [Marinimicrobium sp. ABcell2]